MSRIGKSPISLPSGVEVTINGTEITVKGPGGTLKRIVNPKISVEKVENQLIVKLNSDLYEDKGLHGLFRTLLNNMVIGVTKGYEKRLEVIGVGYRFKTSGSKITLNLGFSHPIEYKAPDTVKFEEDPDNKAVIIIKSIDKEALGEVAAKVRSFRPPEPYKGKGVKYIDERIVRKAGKTAAAGK